MSQKRLELKVGLFVFVGLAVVVALLLLFSKGWSLTPTYELQLQARSAGTLKTRVGVLMSGVPVGYISQIDLAPDGRSVNIRLRIQQHYQIREDARFVIEQSGFLGDQYVAVIPTGDTNEAPLLQNGAHVTAEAPFDLQEVARAAAGFIKRIDLTAQRLNETIADVRREALNEQTLTNLASAVVSLNKFSTEALATVDNLNALVASNTNTIHDALGNVYASSTNIYAATAKINDASANITAATATITNLLGQVQTGQGLLGRVIVDKQLADNLQDASANLSLITSNLNAEGLWHFLWRKHPPAVPAASNAPPNP